MADSIYTKVIYSIKQLIDKANVDDRILLERTLSCFPDDILKTSNGLSYGAYIPGNLPLFSLLTYGLMPSLLCKESVLKIPPMHPIVVEDFVNNWNVALGCKNIVSRASGAEFSRMYNNLDIVFFCGLKSTAKRAHLRHDSARLFIYVGAGINPFIVDKCANVPLAVKAILYDRAYNDGEDCLSADIFFIHDDIYDEIISEVRCHIADLTTSEIAATNPEKPKRLAEYVNESKAKVWSGVYNDRPILILKGEQHVVPPEFMSVVINFHTYNDMAQLHGILTSKEYLKKSHGLTYFGNEIPEKLCNSYNVVAHNITLHEKDHAFLPFGGWGGESSYVIENGVKTNRPVCVYSELLKYSEKRRDVVCASYA